MGASKDEYIMYGVIVVGVVILGYFIYGFLFSSDTDFSPISSSLSLTTISTGSTDEGDVSIDLTPQKIEQGKLYVSLAANTHTVDLSGFNLKQIISLSFDDKVIKPREAPTLSGHHANGMLVFNVGKPLTSFTITIEGIPQQQKRVYQW